MASCAEDKLIFPSFAAGQTNRPCSSRLENRHAPWLSHPLPGRACLHAREEDDLEQIATPSPEYKQMAGKWIFHCPAVDCKAIHERGPELVQPVLPRC